MNRTHATTQPARRSAVRQQLEASLPLLVALLACVIRLVPALRAGRAFTLEEHLAFLALLTSGGMLAGDLRAIHRKPPGRTGHQTSKDPIATPTPAAAPG